ncbi:chemotaxis response regulator protein-glutamate methylesterase [Dyella acidisoli]|uniref:Protein-glutamate methylesterase/protein-glutamine glutaminase n=1 Tax=Dyella acidisoli TaxID=1867834 RepID=A0ABQ5XKP4_9GAMM|nr:chemotaxis response regulator protein-glutamate methylesterase [Dyella acidisoli]GLQ91078.1 chemotaxis response regulator protein-glutamate methylesterase of group 3 operon [Dyella acidisoli]
MKIGIVNDLPMAVEALRRAIAQRPGCTVAWVAHDGIEAVARCEQDPPDLLFMDIVMPGMDGVEATRRIMAAAPCPILIVTVDVGAHASRVFEAMGYGALDAVSTPRMGQPQDVQSLLAKLDVIDKLIGDRQRAAVSKARLDSLTTWQHAPLIAIGASAGGPAALATLLSALPGDFSASIVIVQHVDARFAEGMANWLNEQAALPVRAAKEGDRTTPGMALMAATGDHLALKDRSHLGYTPIPREYVHRPSVNVFFESVVRYWQGNAIGVLLTGMGRDGARGLKAMRDAGYHTIAQDEASCAVFGMPKAAIALDAAVDILPVEHMASRLVSLCSASSLKRSKS